MEQNEVNEIIVGTDVTIELSGKSYVWKEPKRRQLREMSRDLLPIVNKIEEDDPSTVLSAIDNILDFFYKHHPEMNEDREILDESRESEVVTEFMKLATMITLPLRDMTEGLQEIQKQAIVQAELQRKSTEISSKT